MQKLIEEITKEQLRTDIPDFRPGDTVRVHVKVIEGSRERIQVFEGVVIKRRGGGISETFTVRKVSYGVGVERTFPLHTPKIAKIEVVRRGKVRRAKLYYLRNLRGKKLVLKKFDNKKCGSAWIRLDKLKANHKRIVGFWSDLACGLECLGAAARKLKEKGACDASSFFSFSEIFLKMNTLNCKMIFKNCTHRVYLKKLL